MAWHVCAAAAIGKGHVDGGTPCQDAFAKAVAGDMLFAVVCDGAGSHALSHIGSAFLSTHIVNALTEHTRQGGNLAEATDDVVREAVTVIIDAGRTLLSEMAKTDGVDLACYSATVVGVVANGNAGRFFHIGDGLGIAESTQAQAEQGECGATITLPENGEYANETYFFTGDQWRQHLRITAITTPSRCIALMSDGAMPFVMAKGNGQLFRPFMDPVCAFLADANETDGSAALAGTLGDPRTDRITNDDKTLLVALWQ